MDSSGELSEVVVAERTTIADGVVVLTLHDTSGKSLPTWRPGAHIDIQLPTGVTRQYSLCGDPDQSAVWRIAVLRETGGACSAYVHDQLTVGQVVGARGPRNHFELVDCETLFFLAGGIGITPMLPMIAKAEAEGRDWQLLYGGRSRRSMAFVDEIAAYGPRVRIWPEDECGLPPISMEIATLRAGTAIYACGPPGLLDAVTRVHDSRPDCTLHLERFSPSEPSGAEQRSFSVELRRSGVELTVPADCSMLQVLEAAGAQVLSSCRTGTCGTCEVDVLEGQPDHRDDVLTQAEREAGTSLMPCVSRSLTPRIVLDL